MKVSPFDNLPPLSKAEALEILAKPFDLLELSSDYYKAVYHLTKFPCAETEQAFLALIKSNSDDEATRIARRKAVEGLALIGCVSAIHEIGKCLYTKDPYLVESAAWALQELKCTDLALHKHLVCLLDDPNQNRRVLIQSLASMKVFFAVPRIKAFLDDELVDPNVLGAAIAAIAKLVGETNYIHLLKNHLTLLNQNDRQCAVQDVIDSGSIHLLPNVLKAPVATSFRMRAINCLWPLGIEQINSLNLHKLLESVLWDNPNELELVHFYKEKMQIELLINQLFGTDFSRCYLALKTLQGLPKNEIWPCFSRYFVKARKDYGALYFFLILSRLYIDLEGKDRLEIENFTLSALNGNWPDFMKFRPAAILTLSMISPEKCMNYLEQWLNEKKTPFWACRYAALMVIESKHLYLNNEKLIQAILLSKKDSHRFVSAKANQILSN